MRDETSRQANKHLVIKPQHFGPFCGSSSLFSCYLFISSLVASEVEIMRDFRKEREVQNCKPEVASNRNGFETRH